MVEITTKLSGIILTKAEMHGDFSRIYSMVFEKMFNLESIEGDEFLTVLGEIGG